MRHFSGPPSLGMSLCHLDRVVPHFPLRRGTTGVATLAAAALIGGCSQAPRQCRASIQAIAGPLENFQAQETSREKYIEEQVAEVRRQNWMDWNKLSEAYRNRSLNGRRDAYEEELRPGTKFYLAQADVGPVTFKRTYTYLCAFRAGVCECNMTHPHLDEPFDNDRVYFP